MTLSDALNAFRLTPTEEPFLLEGGMINHNYRVSTDNGKIILRKLGWDMNQKWARDANTRKHAVLSHLQSNHFPLQTPEYLTTKDGSFLCNSNENWYEAYHYIDGTQEYNPSLDQMTEAIALYHETMSGFPPPKQPYNTRGASITMAQAPQHKDPIIEDTAKNAYLIIKKGFETAWTYPLDKVPQIMIHSDFHRGNIISENQNIIGIIDFDNIRSAGKVMELATLFPHWTAQEIIDSYRKTGTLTGIESSLLLPYVMARAASVYCWALRGIEKRSDLTCHVIMRSKNTIGQALDQHLKE